MPRDTVPYYTYRYFKYHSAALPVLYFVATQPSFIMFGKTKNEAGLDYIYFIHVHRVTHELNVNTHTSALKLLDDSQPGIYCTSSLSQQYNSVHILSRVTVYVQCIRYCGPYWKFYTDED